MEIRPIFSALLRSKTGPLLVALQVAISLAILANALYIVNLRLLTATRPSGIAEEATVLYMTTRPIKKLEYNDAMSQLRRETEALAAIPGVRSVASTNQMPMSRSGSNNSVVLDRKQTQPSTVASTYFSPDSLINTFGMKLVEGRDFDADDVVDINSDVDEGATKSPKSVIITKALADQLFPGAASALGKTIYLGMGESAIPSSISGVVERLQSTGAGTTPRAEHSVLLPIRINFGYSIYAVRTEPGERDRVLAAAEIALRKTAIAPLQIWSHTVEDDRTKRYRNEKSLAWMLVAVCALLLLITASGIVGMTTLRVAQRRKQIGVRRALGGRRRDIVRLFLTENFMITSCGVALGVVSALALNQLLVSQLELPKLPAPYLLGGAGLFWLLGAVAVYGPAFRAASISPSIATRGT